MSLNSIIIEGARTHNLKNISLEIPHNKLIVITGLSGSGKSSLAFDTIYAEGQRRYLETYNSYARQFVGQLTKPDVDHISGLSPVIAIEQKTVSKNPRSTVGTITEIYDFLRLLFARVSTPLSPATNLPLVSYSEKEIINLVLEKYSNKKILITAPLVKSRKGHYRDLFDQLIKQGFTKAYVDGEIQELNKGDRLDRYKTHDISLIIDRILVNEKSKPRLLESIALALKKGKDEIQIIENDVKTNYSKQLMCSESGLSLPNPEPNLFSFNSPKGMCPSCQGLGVMYKVNTDKIFPDRNLSIKEGGIAPLGPYKNSWAFKQVELISQRHGFDLDTPIKKISEEAIEILINGGQDHFTIASKTLGVERNYHIDFEGISVFIQNQFTQANTTSLKRWAKDFMDKISCESCKGNRLLETTLQFKIAGLHIAELSQMDIGQLYVFFENLSKNLQGDQAIIAQEIIKEIMVRLQFLLDVGLEYLSLNRPSKSLSGGEAQRIRLATQIGSQLVGVLYILDEPSIGLHQRDNERLIKSLESLRDIGNSVLVVEHDKDMILCADHVIDIGPRAGKNGGEILTQGTPAELLKENTLTAAFLNNQMRIEIPEIRRKGNGKSIVLEGCTGNNLKNVTLKLPLGCMIGVSGVSGSGKSTLINETLYPILNAHIFNGVKKPMPYKKISGLEHIDKVIDINQQPIGRTPRSNPATYTEVFGEIRSLFTKTTEATIRGYKPGRFSFNVAGGRCETCQGGGLRVIEMNFLPDVYVPCETCNGKRFNRETLEIRFKGKSISDVLEMTIDESVIFFEAIPKIYRKLKTIQDVGLGYISLGQQSTTLSGGEAQRIKLAAELSKRDTGNTLYILDEPTTGLHFEDIRVLLGVLQKLVDKGNTVLVIEHNLDVIKIADHLIDIGYEGGARGGEIIATGTPEEVAKHKKSHTARFLKKELDL